MAMIPMHPIVGTGADDTIQGSRRADVISGLAGDDVAYGHNGHDEVWGGSGDDTLYGNTGNDKLYGSGGPNLVNATTFTMAEDYEGSFVFEGETAGYRNSFGYYKIDSESGEISNVDIIWENASLQGSGGSLIAGVSSHPISISAGDIIGVFIISNGFSYNNFGALGDGGHYEFRNADGSIATLDSLNPALYHVGEDGGETLMRYHTYHTAGYGDHVGLNPDGIVHTTGILKTDMGTLTLGFEDLYNGGDRDFDDSVFTIDIGINNARFLNAHYNPDTGNGDRVVTVSDDDILYGGSGSDELYGHAGNDYLDGGTSNDELHGGSGDDILLGGDAVDLLYGNSGDDNLDGGTGADVMHGNSGNDIMQGGTGADTMYGGSGDDIMRGGTGADRLEATSGNDSLYGDEGSDYLSGGSGDDFLYGGSGHDEIHGNSGNDFIMGGSAADTINGGSGSDTVSYADADRSVTIDLHGKRTAGGDSDTLISIENAIGSDHDDAFRGSSRDNVLDGGAGDDVIRGTKGADDLTGGSGADAFTYRAHDLDGNFDVVRDYDADEGDFFDFSSFSISWSDTAIEDFLRVEESGDDLSIFADSNGAGGADGWDEVAILEFGSSKTDVTMFDDGMFTFA